MQEPPDAGFARRCRQRGGAVAVDAERGGAVAGRERHQRAEVDHGIDGAAGDGAVQAGGVFEVARTALEPRRMAQRGHGIGVAGPAQQAADGAEPLGEARDQALGHEPGGAGDEDGSMPRVAVGGSRAVHRADHT